METSVVKPATRRGENRAARILEVATDIFLRDGYERASVSEISAAAGGSKTALYLYFGSKEELFRAVVRHAVKDDGLRAWLEDVPIKAAATVFEAAVAVRRDRHLLSIIGRVAEAMGEGRSSHPEFPA